MNYDDFEKEVYGNDTQYMNYEELEVLAGSKVKGSLLWMVFGLIITGITGYFTITNIYNSEVLVNNFSVFLYVALGLEVVTVLAFSAMAFKASKFTLRAMFMFYSLLNGVTLSTLFLAYDLYSILYAFLGTVVLFAVLAIYGYVTNEDLSKYNSILRAGLWALVIMGIINIFMRSDGLMWISSMLGVIVFIIFIAVDVNRIKNQVIEYGLTEDFAIIDKIEIFGALQLYLDFINLFIYILRLVGRRD